MVFCCGRSKFLSKFLKILVKKIREIFPETGTYFFDKFTEKNRDLTALNDSGAITGLEVREGDGVYITYQDGADAVSKKLGSTIVLLGTVTAAQTFDLSSYDGYKTFALGTNIIGYVSGSYNADTGVLTVNASRVSGSVTVSGYGWVEDSGHHRTGNGEMTGTASLNYPKQVFLVY